MPAPCSSPPHSSAPRRPPRSRTPRRAPPPLRRWMPFPRHPLRPHRPRAPRRPSGTAPAHPDRHADARAPPTRPRPPPRATRPVAVPQRHARARASRRRLPAVRLALGQPVIHDADEAAPGGRTTRSARTPPQAPPRAATRPCLPPSYPSSTRDHDGYLRTAPASLTPVNTTTPSSRSTPSVPADRPPPSLAYLVEPPGRLHRLPTRPRCMPARSPSRSWPWSSRGASTPARSGVSTCSAELQCPRDRRTVRFSDVSAFGDFSNTIGQSLAVIGLRVPVRRVSVDARSSYSWPAVRRRWLPSRSRMTPGARATPMPPLRDGAWRSRRLTSAVGGAWPPRPATAVATSPRCRAPPVGSAAPTGPSTRTPPGSPARPSWPAVAAQARARGRLPDRPAVRLRLRRRRCWAVSPSRPAARRRRPPSKASPVDIDRPLAAQALLALPVAPLARVTATAPTAVAPTPGVAPPPPTTTPTSTPSTTPPRPTSGGGSTQGAGGSGGSDPSTTVDAAAATGSLAQTGSDVLAPVLLGLLLVVIGGLAVWFSTRRRGAHA